MTDSINRESFEASQSYEAPSVVDYGKLQEVTAGFSEGMQIDATFPAGTEFGDMTFT